MQEALGSFEVVVVTTMPQEQVQYYGAPAQVWYNIRSPGEDDALLVDILWVNKTATRLPEVRKSCSVPQVTKGALRVFAFDSERSGTRSGSPEQA